MPQFEGKEALHDENVNSHLDQMTEHKLEHNTMSPAITSEAASKTETATTISPQLDSISEMKETRAPTSPALTYPDSRAIVIIGCNRMEQMRLSVLNVFALYGVEKYSVYLSLGCPERVNKDV